MGDGVPCYGALEIVGLLLLLLLLLLHPNPTCIIQILWIFIFYSLILRILACLRIIKNKIQLLATFICLFDSSIPR